MIFSKWILGFAGQPRTQDDAQWYDTFMGGHCVYPENFNVAIPPCPLCGAQRFLVLQAFAPHNSHPERAIYLFACNSIRCASHESSWFAMRLCKEVHILGTQDESVQHRDETRGDLDVNECDDEEPINWDTDSDNDGSTASDLVADLAALSLQVQHTKDKGASKSTTSNHTNTIGQTKRNADNQDSSLPPNNNTAQSEHDPDLSQSQNTFHLNSYYVDVEEEPERTNPVVQDSAVGRLLTKYEKEERSRAASGVSEGWRAEVEEKELAASENFEIFQDRISRAPQQILRYRFDGEPIWPKYPPPTMQSTPKCECGSPLVFEVQVLGSCLHYLQPDKSVEPQRKEAGMNFAAVAIYTCQADCTSSEKLAHSPSFKILRQVVVVQQDEW